MKLQFGCGGNQIEGWQNYDRDCDVTKPLPFPNESAERILAEHVLEHISAPDMLRFMDECYRILIPTGVLRICCPVIDNRLTLEHARDLTFGHGHQVVLTQQVMRTLFWMAGFKSHHIRVTERAPEDGHWRAIGKEKDDLETCRVEGTKDL
jgi:predicted SAM-dependent methyltransferase